MHERVRLGSDELYIPSAEIDSGIANVAHSLGSIISSRETTLISVLNGGGDLGLSLGHELVNYSPDIIRDFMQTIKMNGVNGNAPVRILGDLKQSPRGMYVIIAEDLLDTQDTIDKVVERVAGHEPEHIEIVTLGIKPGNKLRHVNLQKHMPKGRISVRSLFRFHDDAFVLGRGMDWKDPITGVSYYGLLKHITVARQVTDIEEYRQRRPKTVKEYGDASIYELPELYVPAVEREPSKQIA